METKYTIHFARPVFERLTLEVTASSEEEAIFSAVHTLMTDDEKEKQWSGEFDGDNYTGFVESVIEHDEFDSGSEDINETRKYMILQADMDTAEGGIIPQPWLIQQNPLMIADLCQDWNAQLTLLEQGELENYVKTLHPEKSARIIPFPKGGKNTES